MSQIYSGSSILGGFGWGIGDMGEGHGGRA